MRFEHARQAIHDAYAIHHRGGNPEVTGASSLPACRGKNKARASATVTKKGNPWAIVDQVEAGKIIAAVEALPAVARAWMLFAYAPSRFAGQHVVEQLIEHAYGAIFGTDGDSWSGKAVKTQRVLRLVSTALQDLAHSLVSMKPKFTAAERAREIGVGVKNWHRDWSPLYIKVLSVFGALDQAGLPSVIGVVIAEREKRKPDYDLAA